MRKLVSFFVLRLLGWRWTALIAVLGAARAARANVRRANARR